MDQLQLAMNIGIFAVLLMMQYVDYLQRKLIRELTARVDAIERCKPYSITQAIGRSSRPLPGTNEETVQL